MTGFGDVFDSLQTMTHLELLLAFVACIGYALAQGSLLARQGRRLSWLATTFATAGFAFEIGDWTHAVVLVGVALAGMGSFVAAVWLTSRLLGVTRASSAPRNEPADSEASTLSPPDTRPRAPRPRDHAHSV